MIVCPHCGKRVPNGRKTCYGCGRPTRDAPERKLPIVTAIIALAFGGLVIFGATSAILSRVGTTSGDVALHIDGTWETEGPTYNDELITFVFTGDSFSREVETMIFGAGAADIEDIETFQRDYNGATVDAEDLGDGTFRLRITADGTFALDGNSILLISGEGLLRMFSFYWEDEAVIINGDRFVRR